MRFNPGSFNQLLNGIGQTFEWRKSFACPCINSHSGAPKPNCKHCSGKGRLWDAAIVGKAGIAGRDQMKDVAAFGVLDQGDIMLTIPSDSPLYFIGQFDRVSAMNRSEPFSLNMVRGRNDVMRLPSLEIVRAFWLDPSDVIQESDIPDVSTDGVLSWGENPPPMGVTYSLTGRRVPEFFVYLEMPFDRPLHHGSPLPRRVVLRKFDLFGR